MKKVFLGGTYNGYVDPVVSFAYLDLIPDYSSDPKGCCIEFE